MLRLPESPGRRRGLVVLAALFFAAGTAHFVRPDFYVAIMPPWIPWHRELVFLSGVLEIAGGAGLLHHRTRRVAGWGLILLLAAVFPANLHMALEPEAFQRIPEWLLWLRLPFQPLLMLWAWWVSRPEDAG